MSEGKLYIKDTRTCQDYEIPIIQNTVKAADLCKIHAPVGDSDPADRVDKGLRLLDAGFHNTAGHESKVTWVDGESGTLLFRGHAVEDLWDCDYEDMLHLVVWGTLPTPEQKHTLRLGVAETACSVPESVHTTIRSFPKDSPALPMILGGLAAYLASNPTTMPAFNGGSHYHSNNELIDSIIIKVIGTYLVVVGVAYSHREGTKFEPPSCDRAFFENLLVMIGHVDKDGQPDPIKLECFKHAGSMGADHEMSNSTFSFLVTASSLADPISGLISALCSGYGPLHMGACESAYKTMQKIEGPENAHLVIDAAKTGKRRLYGYGHRIWRLEDPRISRFKDLIKALGANSPDRNPVVATALEIDRLASQDEYFVKRNLHANVDLYVIIFGVAMGFPVDFVPVMIVCLRLPGLMAHWKEAMNREIKLIRPAGIYKGPTKPVRASKGRSFQLRVDKNDQPPQVASIMSDKEDEPVCPRRAELVGHRGRSKSCSDRTMLNQLPFKSAYGIRKSDVVSVDV